MYVQSTNAGKKMKTTTKTPVILSFVTLETWLYTYICPTLKHGTKLFFSCTVPI